VKFRWPVLIAFPVLFSIFFHYEIRWHQRSMWVEIVGGAVIYLACNIAYVVLFEKKRSEPI
jgi:hypothetical protein